MIRKRGKNRRRGPGKKKKRGLRNLKKADDMQETVGSRQKMYCQRK
jgi:hypothetical protein